jgi:hypothetical protein
MENDTDLAEKLIVTVVFNDFDWTKKVAIDNAITDVLGEELIEFEHIGSGETYKANLYIKSEIEAKHFYDTIYDACNDEVGEITGAITITTYNQETFSF